MNRSALRLRRGLAVLGLLGLVVTGPGCGREEPGPESPPAPGEAPAPSRPAGRTMGVVLDLVDLLPEATVEGGGHSRVQRMETPLQGQTVPGLRMPVGGEVTLPAVRVPSDVALEFLVGRTPDSPGDQPYQFWLSVLTEDGTETTVYSREITQDGWLTGGANLASWADQTIRLRFSVTGPSGAGAWVRPRLYRRDAPKILLITADTFRYDHIAAVGERPIQTPVLDRLIQEGVFFTRGYATSNNTNPAHASLLTGLYPKDHQVYDNRTPLGDGPPTLAERLRREGYLTGAILSSSILTRDLSGLDRGFEYWEDCQALKRTARETSDLAVRWLNHRADRPFFLWVHYFDPHRIYDPPPPYDTRYQEVAGQIPLPVPADEITLPPNWIFQAGDRRIPRPIRTPAQALSLYMGEVSYLDAALGTLLNALGGMGVLEETLVVFVADHGESLVEHGVYFEHNALWEDIIHVPLIFWGKGVAQGLEVDELVSGVDLTPTLLDWVGLPPFDQTRGVSLRPLVEGSGAPEALARRPVVSEQSKGIALAVTRDRFRYLVPLIPGPMTVAEPMLFDILTDPGETTDLSAQEQTVLGAMHALVLDWPTDAFGYAPGTAALSPEQERKLRALGYAR